MIIKPNQKYQINAELSKFLNASQALACNNLLSNNLNFLDHLTCHASGKIINIVFNPPTEITDDYLFEIIETTLQSAGITFVKAILRQYVGSAVKTAAGATTGGALGSRLGPFGILLGLIGGAIITKAIFDWKDLCICTRNKFGNLIISYLVEGVT